MRNRDMAICAAPSIALAIALALRPPIAQSPEFHDFADRRAFLGVPNFLDVATNLPFLVIGIIAFVNARNAASSRDMRAAYFAFAASLTATAFGSAYYHFAPTNETLVFDRLPLAALFASIFAIIFGARCGRPLSVPTLVAAIALSIGSVLYWAVTESLGAGDLRPYILVQFGGMASIAAVLWVRRRAKGPSAPFLIALCLYAFALAFQEADRAIFNATSGLFGGHAWKHLFAAAATFVLARRSAVRQGMSQ